MKFFSILATIFATILITVYMPINFLCYTYEYCDLGVKIYNAVIAIVTFIVALALIWGTKNSVSIFHR